MFLINPELTSCLFDCVLSLYLFSTIQSYLNEHPFVENQQQNMILSTTNPLKTPLIDQSNPKIVSLLDERIKPNFLVGNRLCEIVVKIYHKGKLPTFNSSLENTQLFTKS